MAEPLTIVGASVRAAAASAVRGGYLVHAGDMFADADLVALCQATRVTDYPRALAAVIHGRQVGGWMYTGALENQPTLVDRLARVRPLWGNSGAGLRQVRDPLQVAQTLRAAGLQCPDVHSRPPREVTTNDHWLRKPIRSAGGAHISFFQEAAGHTRLPAAEPRRRASHQYFQRYVDGLPCAATFLAAGRKAVLLGVTRQLIGLNWTGSTGFCYCGSIGPIEVADTVRATLVRIGNVLAERFALVGLFGVDVIVNQQGVWPVEVNPRYTASMELFDWACSISTVAWHVTACQHGRLSHVLPPVRQGPLFGKAIVLAARGAVVGNELEGPARQRLPNDWPSIADVPPQGTRIEALAPIVTVMAAGRDEHDVLAQLRQKTAAIRAAVGEAC